MKFSIIDSDPPWSFSDKLKMSKTKRGAASQYSVLSDKDIINLPVKDLAEDNAVLALWVPSSKLEVGLKTCTAWGFKPTQTFIWVKIKKQPLNSILKEILKAIKNNLSIKDIFANFNMDKILSCYLGHCFRQTHEICIIGVRGKYKKILKNKSQVSVHLSPNKKHSEKPEELQNRLDIMFPGTKKLEMFARRNREGYICIGNEAPDTLNEDIRVSLAKLVSE